VSKEALEANRLELVGDVTLLTASSSSAAAESTSSCALRIVGCGYPGHGEGVQLLIVNSNTVEPLAPAEEGEKVGAVGAVQDGEASAGWAALPEGQVGEIWVASASKAQGYWDQPALSQHEFHAPLPANATAAGPAAQDGFLRTGDLGFMHNGELFICGRMKDLIIVRGRNHYPQDIERTAEQHVAEYLRAGCSGAFSLSGGQERHTEDVVYVAEVSL
jgi:acyl-CoA synthetase (AMP-forming)/AMP-acid ligase II